MAGWCHRNVAITTLIHGGDAMTGRCKSAPYRAKQLKILQVPNVSGVPDIFFFVR
jgi:hypothetical protein